MAITGSFQDIPLQEILSTVRKRSGKLLIFDHDLDQNYELHLREGILCKFAVNNYSVYDVVRIREYIRSLMRRNDSTFEFHRMDANALEDDVALPVGRLSLVMSTDNIAELIEQHKERLPHPETRFTLVPGFDFLGGESLEIFYQSARNLLSTKQGVSAKEIIQKIDLPMSIDVVRYYIYQLRAAGAIVPIRAYQGATTNQDPEFMSALDKANLAQKQKAQPNQPHAAEPQQKASGGGIISRLLNALRRSYNSSKVRQ